MEAQRPSRTQEILRQWILFIPLATALVGSLLVQRVSDRQQEILLPATFYVGALIVTSAMLHQRYLLNRNVDLTEQVQEAHAQLDDLHHLSVTLTKSLDAGEIARAALQHTQQMLGAQACALWLRADFLPPEVRHSFENTSGDQDHDAPADDALADDPTTPKRGERWLLVASSGFEGEMKNRLQDWEQTLNEGGWQRDELHCNIQGGLENNARLCSLVGFESAICTPVVMKGEANGALLVTSRRRLNREQAALAQSIAFITGPALHNSLIYQAASLRAEMDGLTNLFNHRAMQERLAQEVARVHRQRTQTPEVALAVATMDVNDFKIFNDTYGHATGDRVLRTISDTLRQTFRTSDIVGRFGGDEFVAILPDTDRAGAEVLCQRVAQSVAARHFEAPDGSTIQIRITCGVSDFPHDAEGAADLLRVADARLYVAKRRGVSVVEGEEARPATMQPRWADVGVLEALITAIDNKDRYTRAYSERVWHHALLLAQQMELPEDVIQATGLCSLVHDVGKIIVPDSILRKPGRLTAEEMSVVQQHPNFGAIIVRDVPHLDLVLGGVRHHHEHFNGSGYPDGLKGQNIPLLGRLLAVPVCFAAMTTDRPYRKALEIEDAMTEIKAGSGQLFDPEMVAAFERVMQENVALAMADGEN